MRPYLAIIKDSFRAAMASRVLYVLLLLITLLLVALAPAHVRESLDWKLVRDINTDPDQLVEQLVARRAASPAGQRIWSLLSDDLQSRLLSYSGSPAEETKAEEAKSQDEKSEITGEVDTDDADDAVAEKGAVEIRVSTDTRGMVRFAENVETQDRAIKELNEIIERRDFYRTEDWQSGVGNEEARGLIDEGIEKLSDIRVKRLNRVLIGTTLDPAIVVGRPVALDFYYAIWNPFSIPFTRQQFAQMMTTWLPFYFEKMVLSIGLLIAIIITAGLIPETFEPGSLNLLLSKPISRWGLYVSKFVGGCVFIALCATYLFVGLWLWFGFGMGIWDRAMLLSIPLYIIVFAIYFSVSSFVGLIWRNAIVSVIVTLIFWVACFLVGSVYGFFKTKMSNDAMIAVVPVGDKLIGSDVLHQAYLLDNQQNVWRNLRDNQFGDDEAVALMASAWFVPLQENQDMPGIGDFIRPVVDLSNNRVLTSSLEFDLRSSARKKMLLADIDEMDFRSIGIFPGQTLGVFETPEGIVAVTARGSFQRLNSERYEDAVAKAFDPDNPEVAAETPPANPRDRRNRRNRNSQDDAKVGLLFDTAGPTQSTDIRNADQVSYNFSRDEFVIYNRGKLSVYGRDEEDEAGEYQLSRTLEMVLDFDDSMTAKIAMGRRLIAVAFGNGRVVLVEADAMKELESFQLEQRSAIKNVQASPDGQYLGILYRNGNLWTLDGNQQPFKFQLKSMTGQGKVEAFAFAEKGELVLIYDIDRVAKYDLQENRRRDRLVPSSGILATSYRLLIRPLYRVFPKPGEFYKVVTHLASSGDSEANEEIDLNKTPQVTNPYAPLWSGLSFMIVMLGLACWVFYRKDY